jgi:hypothetical protein
MRVRYLTGALPLVAALLMTITTAAAFDESNYPDFGGHWRRATRVQSNRIGAAFDPSKPFGREEKPPLTPEYQAIYEANLVDMEKGGQGIDPTYSCLSPGMPRVMIPYIGMEFVVTPRVTYILFERDWDFNRHIYTDGRGFPADMALEPRFLGYSIGKWLDTDGDGRYDTLEVETRGMKGPRVYDASGIPLHADNETVVQERIYLDKADPPALICAAVGPEYASPASWPGQPPLKVADIPNFGTRRADRSSVSGLWALRPSLTMPAAVDKKGRHG